MYSLPETTYFILPFTLLNGKYMHVDATYLRLDGKNAYACICTNGTSVLYQGRKHKGHEMIKGTPIELYEGLIISDREAVFINREPNEHQICLVHIDRELSGIIENEPKKKWAPRMQKFLKDTVKKYGKKGASDEEQEQVLREFSKIVSLGLSEYPEKPNAQKEYVKGYNLVHALNDMQKKNGAVLYFVSHEGTPSNNNEAEQGARSLKRKVKQAEGFRSVRELDGTCCVKSVLDTARHQGKNKLKLCVEILGRKTPRAVRRKTAKAEKAGASDQVSEGQ